MAEHHRRFVRRWLCVCGHRWTCDVHLHHRDEASRRTRPARPGAPAATKPAGAAPARWRREWV